MWHYDKRGEYSVKSGYQLAQKIQFPNNPSSSSNNHKQWNALWALDLSEKIKIFIWRAFHNLLPIAENLWKRKVLQEPICQRCRRGAKTIHHSLLECKALKKIWNYALFAVKSCNDPTQDIFTTIQDMGIHLRKSDVEL